MAHEPSDPDILIAPERLIVGSLDEFRQAVIAAVAQAGSRGVSRLAVDLRGTRAIDATGLGVLLLLHKRAREQSIKVRLLGPSSSVLEVLKTTRVHLLFEVIDASEVDGTMAPTTPEPTPEPTPESTPEPTPEPTPEEPASAALPFLSVEETGDPHPPVILPPAPVPEPPPVADAELVLEANPYFLEPSESAPVVLPEPIPAPEERSVEVVEVPVEAAVEPPVESPPVAVPEAPEVVPAPRLCSKCGRALPTDREVQYCPWCGRNEEGASAPTPAPASVPASVPAPSVVPTPRRSTPAPGRPSRPSRPTTPAIASRSSVAIPTRTPAPRPSVPVPPTPTMSTVVPQRRNAMPASSDEFRTLMDATQLYHRIDEDGDARIIFPLESGRTQTAWITRNVDTIGEYAFRYVMSFVADVGEVASNVALMSSLLEQVSAAKGGGLVTRGSMLLYRMPVATQASPESLAGAVALAAGIADELETAITGES